MMEKSYVNIHTEINPLLSLSFFDEILYNL
jgi:hypothetical protein